MSDAPSNSNYSLKLYAPSVDVNTMKGPNGDGSNEDGTEYRTTNGIILRIHGLLLITLLTILKKKDLLVLLTQDGI